MSVIEELFLKNTENIKIETDEHLMSKKLCEIEKYLRTILNAEQQSVFDKYLECESELENIIARKNFTTGFKLSTQILIEALTNEN